MKTFHFRYEGEILRVRGLEDDSGVYDSRKVNTRKWVMERFVDPNWVRDSWVCLDNNATIEVAVARFGFADKLDSNEF